MTAIVSAPPEHAVTVSLPVDAIRPSPHQNREHFDEDALAGLASTIATKGLLSPVAVRPDGAGGYWLIAGERRLRACRDILGWATIPAMVHDIDDETAAYLTLVENMARENTDPMEDARGLAAAPTTDVGELARIVGRSPHWVRDRLRLLSLTAEAAHLVASGQLSLRRAVLLAGLDANRQHLAVIAHRGEISTAAFEHLAGRLADDQATETMFDADSFLQLDEWVADAEAATVPVELADTGRIPLGVSEIAERFAVTRSCVQKWQTRGQLPPPDMRVSGTPIWWDSTLERWAVDTGRAS